MTDIETRRSLGFKRRPAIFLLWAVLALAILNASCSNPEASADKTPKHRGVPVTVAPVLRQDVPLELDTFGWAQSKATVTIKAQVTQVIQAVHFQEGQEVSRGQLLFTLDSRPYEAALAQAQAALARDKVLCDDARSEAKRDAELRAKKILSESDYEKAKSTADALFQTLKADQAAIDTARINLDNCRIVSPIQGRVGKILVQAGNLVTANSVSLVIINQIKPIDVFFSLPQAELDRIRAYQRKAKLAVEATIPGERNHSQKGVLTFIDNCVDASNGTIELGATFPNPDERLWPGRYVLVHLVLAVEHDAVVAPLRAIVTGSAGQYVFVVKEGRTVEQRSVKVERTLGDEAVIEAGLQAGESVVTDGQLQLEEGSRIEPIGEANEAPSGGTTPTKAGAAL